MFPIYTPPAVYENAFLFIPCTNFFFANFFLICVSSIMILNKKNYVFVIKHLKRIIMNRFLWPRLMGHFQRKALSIHKVDSGEACLAGLATSQSLRGYIIMVHLPVFKLTSTVVSILGKSSSISQDLFQLTQVRGIVCKARMLIH